MKSPSLRLQATGQRGRVLGLSGLTGSATRRSLNPFSLILNAALVSCYIPFSFPTGAGFVSAVDIIVSVLLLYSMLLFSKSRRLSPRSLPILTISTIAWICIFISQFASDHMAVVSPLIKYFTFLVAIPWALALSGEEPQRIVGVANFPRVMAFSGVFLILICLAAIAHGDSYRGGGALALKFFGQDANKNALGVLLTFSVFCSVWTSLRKFNLAVAFAGILSFLFILYLGARSSSVIALGGSILIYLAAPSTGAARVRGMFFAFVFIAPLATALLGYGLLNGIFDEQINRFFEPVAADQNGISSAGARLILWPYAIDSIQKHPIFGAGYGTFNYVGANWLNGLAEPHNNVLQILYAGGWLGFSVFVLLLIVGLGHRRRTDLAKLAWLCGVCYILDTAVDIIWTRGDGHIFWILFFLQALSPELQSKRANKNFRVALPHTNARISSI